jgi:hypothetical protein
MKGILMYEIATKLILSQRYIQKLDGAKAMLVDICGNDAIVELEQGQLLKISTETFKTRFQLCLCA